ncbi:MAG: RNA polymerase sigma factor [Verrucomicrobiota bacterium]
MNLNQTTLTVMSDDQLCQQSRAGDREAFGRIVERYQSLICSLAYSACGNLSRSEDLAQETFVAAWQKLAELREPSKLRAWLCGIVRNLAANASRREQRRGGPAESLDLVAEPATADADPAAHAVTHEEETLLWRSLAGLPETYREPMVLFYRQGQSVAEVANSLGLSEEAVKQRLSRGRTMLREEMTALVESTLTRTGPTAAFTVGVLVALPMASASAASAALTAGAATGGSAGAAGKGLLAKLGLGAFVGPLIGLVCAYFGTKAAASTARSKEERDCILRYARYGIIVFCLVMSIGLAAVLSQAGKLYTASAAWLVLGVSAWTAVLVGGIMLMCQRMDREVKRIRIATNTTDEAYAKVLAVQGKQLRLPKYFESELRLLGLPLFAMAWGGNSSDRHRPRPVCGWIAVGDIAVSPFLAFGGVAAAPIAVGALTVGVLSLSVFWGVAFGVFALGSLAFGWWALGCAAVGVKCAVGFAAVARDYAVGIVASATEAGTTAKDWVKTQWLADFAEVMVHQMHWWILGCVAVALALALRVWRDRQQRRESQLDAHTGGC